MSHNLAELFCLVDEDDEIIGYVDFIGDEFPEVLSKGDTHIFVVYRDGEPKSLMLKDVNHVPA